jgi:predicted nucleotidyltransferase
MRRDEAVERLKDHFPELQTRFGVAHLSVFGSVARNEAGPDSDVDVLVEFSPDVRVGLFGFVRLQRRLGEILGVKVDLATPGALKRQLREQVLRELVRAA